MAALPPLTVVTIAHEPVAVLGRFIRWHLLQGADRIIVFLDDPADPAQTVLAGDPRVEFRPCTPSLWAGLGVAPGARFTKRQRAAMTAAYREVRDGWVMILDADELMWFAGRDLPRGLAELPSDTKTLRVRSAEEVAA